MQKRSSKSESTRKTEQNRSCWKILTMVKVNGQSQRSTPDVACVTSPRVDVAGRDAAAGACGAWVRVVWRVGARGRYWRRVERVFVRQKLQAARAHEAKTSASAWRCVWYSFWPFLVGFCSGLAVLSFYAFYLAVECAERWYPSVAGTVGVIVVARFWQWRLDEGEGSGRMPKMSTRTRKSEEWLWYHVNNIKWEKKTE